MKFQSNIGRIVLIICAIGVLALPLMAQQNPPSTSPNDRQEDVQSPSQSPPQQTPGADTTPGDRSPNYTSDGVDENRAGTSGFAWGTLISGLAIGGIVGYLLGMSTRSRGYDDARRDHAA
jgi:hypothetical protein